MLRIPAEEALNNIRKLCDYDAYAETMMPIVAAYVNWVLGIDAESNDDYAKDGLRDAFVILDGGKIGHI